MNKQKKAWNIFLKLCLNTQNTKLLSSLLDLILTPEEKNDINDRLLIISELLEANKTQRNLSKELNVSIAKITRGSNALKSIDKSLEIFLKENL